MDSAEDTCFLVCTLRESRAEDIAALLSHHEAPRMRPGFIIVAFIPFGTQAGLTAAAACCAELMSDEPMHRSADRSLCLMPDTHTCL